MEQRTPRSTRILHPQPDRDGNPPACSCLDHRGADGVVVSVCSCHPWFVVRKRNDPWPLATGRFSCHAIELPLVHPAILEYFDRLRVILSVDGQRHPVHPRLHATTATATTATKAATLRRERGAQ